MGDDGTLPAGETVDEEELASLVTESFSWIKLNAAADDIQLAAWYNLRDFGGTAWDGYAGLQGEDGSLHPAWYAFQEQTGAERSGDIWAAFQAETGTLWTYSTTGGYVDTGLAMQPGTSPVVATQPGGGALVAFTAADGQPEVYSTATGHPQPGPRDPTGSRPRRRPRLPATPSSPPSGPTSAPSGRAREAAAAFETPSTPRPRHHPQRRHRPLTHVDGPINHDMRGLSAHQHEVAAARLSGQ